MKIKEGNLNYPLCCILFYNCTSLNYVKCLATANNSNCTYNCLYNVASTGTFVKDSNATWTIENSDGIPSGWTVENA